MASGAMLTVHEDALFAANGGPLRNVAASLHGNGVLSSVLQCSEYCHYGGGVRVGHFRSIQMAGSVVQRVEVKERR